MRISLVLFVVYRSANCVTKSSNANGTRRSRSTGRIPNCTETYDSICGIAIIIIINRDQPSHPWEYRCDDWIGVQLDCFAVIVCVYDIV